MSATTGGGMSLQDAEAVWEVLAEECAAAETDKDTFLRHQTEGPVPEFRFIGNLGFGGKFWRTMSRRPDGTWGECWFVNCYPDEQNPAYQAIIDRTNERLWTIQQSSELTTQREAQQ